MAEMLDPCVVLWILVPHIMSKGLCWKHYELPILLEVPVEMLLNQCFLRSLKVHIFYCPTSLRVDSIGYSWFPTTHCCWPLVLKGFFSSYQIASSYFSMLSPLPLLPVPNFSVFWSRILLLVESLFEPWGPLSKDVFWSLTQIMFFPLSHVSCCCTETLLQLANPSNFSVGNSHNAIKTFLSPGLLFLFDHLFEDGMPLIVVSLSPALLWIPP